MKFRRMFAAAALAVASLVTPAVNCVAADNPVAVVSVAPLDRLKSDLSYVLEAANFGSLAPVVNMYGDFYTKGIDSSKPIAVVVTLQGQVPSALICVPMTDMEAFTGALVNLGVEADSIGDDMYEILPPGAQTLFGKLSGDWLYVAQSEDALAGELPADPAALLGKFPQTYDIAVRLSVQDLPEDMKAMVGEQMRAGFEASMSQQTGQTDEERALAEEMGKAQIAQIEQLLAETEQVFLGWAVKPGEQNTFIDAGVRFLAGTKLATQANASKGVQTEYGSFMKPNAAASFNFTSQIPESDRPLAIQNFRNSMNQAASMMNSQGDLPPEAEELLKGLLDGIASVTEKTIEEGLFDSAGSLGLQSGVQFLMAGRVADGGALAAEVKKFAAGLPADVADKVTFEFDYATHGSMTLHKVSAPVGNDPKAKQVFGDQVEILVATGEKSFAVALDTSGDAALKTAIDGIGKSEGGSKPPFAAAFQMGQILTFVQSISPNAILDNAVSTIQEYAGKDSLTITGSVIDRGATYRLRIDEGILRAAGAAGQGGAGGGF